MLLRESLDLGLITYRVLATGTAQGFTQFVPSQSLAAVLSDHNNSIAQYLRQISTSDTSFAELMENYVKSCAGYCVITYILAVGDRHLDNLLLTRAGKLFHVDYGYILGNDPKPFPPPMKLCKEMAEAMMIDPSLVWYRKFRSASFMAYSILRKVDNFNLIYNLFRLMSTASSGLPDLTAEPDRALKVIEDRYRLDLTDDLAVQYLQSVISDSINALFPQVIETIHKWAQYWRS
ncbi:Phosphatidylinositol 3-kinase, root isoform [Zancudomyces culisetae]|uniref:phosphatidylinositol 3-kinase n=1 Tax=Zancudomyces culisetae TaxID=1213189 RepID=A0A1R1PCZ5_ZANCU|nr:Phosphatidylinositol 3-kinase, root isoform [Zancudomyces culisetae]|eukprot:OMH78844.1 Phosphatidylinositol 3-kinase, root isoform [Zancudomyces culisetae]